MLTRNRITRDGGVALCYALRSHKSLNYLKLSCCAIQDEGAEAIAQLLGTNRKLKEYIFLSRIYLDYNRITGKGLLAIAKGLRQNVMVRYLALWGNQWDNESCEAFCELMGGPSSVVLINDPKAVPEKASSIRLGPNSTDFTFCRVEGTLQVAHLERVEVLDS